MFIFVGIRNEKQLDAVEAGKPFAQLNHKLAMLLNVPVRKKVWLPGRFCDLNMGEGKFAHPD